MSYRAILFDADGMTIISPRFSERIEREYGIPWEKMKPFFSGPFARCKLGQADLKEELANVIAEWGWQGSVDELVNYWFSCCELNPDIIHLVQELRAQGIRCSLATNQEACRATYLRQTIGLKTVFDELFVSAEIGYTKNDVRFFEAVYHQLSKTLGPIKRSSILFADHEEQNLTAANSFGFSTHNYSTIKDFRAAITTGPVDHAFS